MHFDSPASRSPSSVVLVGRTAPVGAMLQRVSSGDERPRRQRLEKVRARDGPASYTLTMNTVDDLLYLPEVAEHCRTPISSVRHWVRTGRLLSIRPGRRRMVRRSDLERFLSTPQPIAAAET